MLASLESLQFAFFSEGGTQSDTIELWNTTFGSKPSSFQTFGVGHTQAQGEAGQLVFSLISQPGRFDLVLHPSPNAAALGLTGGIRPPTISNFDDAVAEATQFAERLVQSISVGRTAAVLQGSLPADSASTAVRNIREFVPEFPIPDGATEAQYQVVVPRFSSKVPTRRLTRFCRWQSIKLQFLQLGGPAFGQVGTSAPLQSTSAPLHATHVYADVFGDVMENLTPEQAIESLHEVTDIAVGIFRDGLNALRS